MQRPGVRASGGETTEWSARARETETPLPFEATWPHPWRQVTCSREKGGSCCGSSQQVKKEISGWLTGGQTIEVRRHRSFYCLSAGRIYPSVPVVVASGSPAAR
jgi:hypothetical protein